MKYRVTHKTSYAGHEAVSIGHNQAWLELRPVDWQLVESFSLVIDPPPSIRTRRIDSSERGMGGVLTVTTDIAVTSSR